ncbi:MAG: ATP-binding protein [Tabrizicola sp.]|jgi:serine/threonine-protein kinase RsbW|nr:ATP-binding protein [Tabrizicola sp.]
MQPVPDTDRKTANLHLVFQADPASVRQALAGMLDLPPLGLLPRDDKGLAELVLAEVLNNVAEHAYGEAGGEVAITLALDPAGIRCLIVDGGRAMPGERLPEGRLPDARGTALEDLPEGGFGWHLIRSLSSDLSYARVDGQNRLAFVLPGPGRGPADAR